MKTLQTILEGMFDDEFGVDSNAAAKEQVKVLLAKTHEMWSSIVNKHKEPSNKEVDDLNLDWNELCEGVGELFLRAKKAVLFDKNIFVLFDEQRLKYILAKMDVMNGYIGFEFKSGKPYRYGKIDNWDLTNDILVKLRMYKLPESVIHYRKLLPINIKNL